MLRILAAAVLVSLSALAQPATISQFLLRLEPVRNDFPQNMTDEERRLGGQHFAYLQSLLAEGKLTFAGQALDPKGFWGFAIINASGAEAAQAILNGDPGIKGKLMRGEVIPFRTVLERRAEAAPAK